MLFNPRIINLLFRKHIFPANKSQIIKKTCHKQKKLLTTPSSQIPLKLHVSVL